MPTAPSRLSSRQHPIVRAFKQAAAHPDEGVVLLDGPHLIGEALAAGVSVRTVLATAEFLERAPATHRQVAKTVRQAGAALYEATAAVLAAASPVRTPSGIVALADWTPAPIADVFHRSPALVLGLLDVQDPGNVGAVIRSADGLSATGVIGLDRTAHPGGWKALRGAMGSTFHLPVGRGGHDDAIRQARASGLRICATVSGEATDIKDRDWTQPTFVIFGNEGAGLPDAIANATDERITVPMRAGIESLNVAVTAALVLYEARRQRTL